jgi:type IV secretion system protein VirB2
MTSAYPRSAARIAGIAAAFLFLIGEAFAQGTLQPVQSTLQTLVQALTGPIATSLAILAVIACGFLAFTGRLTWGIAGSVIFGIVLVFGSAQIVQFFQSAVGR